MKRIMIDVDFSNHTEKVLDAGLDIAAKYDAEVILLHAEKPAAVLMDANVVGPYGGMSAVGLDLPTVQEIVSEQVNRDETIISELKERVESKGLSVRTEVVIGNEVPKIIEECHKYQPDLLVLGLHKVDFFARMFGDNPEFELVKKAPCSLLIVPEIVS